MTECHLSLIISSPLEFVLQAHLKATRSQAQTKAFKRACKNQPLCKVT